MKHHKVAMDLYMKVKDRMSYLYQRFNDEYMYEDIKEYQDNFQDYLSEFGDFDIISFEIKPNSSFEVIVDILGKQYLFYIDSWANEMGAKTIPNCLKVDWQINTTKRRIL